MPRELNKERESPPSRRVLPGMPTPRGEILQFLLLLSPTLIALMIALLLSVISMLRHMIR